MLLVSLNQKSISGVKVFKHPLIKSAFPPPRHLISAEIKTIMANDPATKPQAENGTGAAADLKNNADTLAAGAKSNGAAAKKNMEEGYGRCLFVYQVLVGYVVEVKVRDHSNQILFGQFIFTFTFNQLTISF